MHGEKKAIYLKEKKAIYSYSGLVLLHKPRYLSVLYFQKAKTNTSNSLK